MFKLNRLSKRMIILLAAVSALGPVGMQILLPALPVIKQKFYVTNDVAQLTLSLSMLAIAIGTLVYGPLSDKFGRKRVMLVGIVITIFGSIVCFVADSIMLSQVLYPSLWWCGGISSSKSNSARCLWP